MEGKIDNEIVTDKEYIKILEDYVEILREVWDEYDPEGDVEAIAVRYCQAMEKRMRGDF